MEHTGNTIGAEGRRGGSEDDPKFGDKPDMEEKAIEREMREAEQEGADALTAEVEEPAGQPVPGPEQSGLDDVSDPEGVKPGTVSELKDRAKDE